MRLFQPDKGRVGIAIDNVVTLSFNQRFGLAHDRMAAHGNGRGQSRVEKATGGGSQHAVKCVHDNFQRLRERLIAAAFCFIATMPDPGHDFRQAVLFT